jgi:hypothetical protein
MKAILSLLALAALAGCATPSIGSPSVRTDGLARLNESVQVGALTVTPRRVIEDSRCPTNARCVWAGRAIVRTEVKGRGWRESLDLTLGTPIATHGTTIALTSVEPGKLAGAETPSRPYVFGFEGGR